MIHHNIMNDVKIWPNLTSQQEPGWVCPAEYQHGEAGTRGQVAGELQNLRNLQLEHLDNIVSLESSFKKEKKIFY